LVYSVTLGAGQGATEIEEHHAADAGSAVVDGGAKAEGAAAVAGRADIGCIVGIGGRRTHHSTVS
jgi:hypothetical protein